MLVSVKQITLVLLPALLLTKSLWVSAEEKITQQEIINAHAHLQPQTISVGCLFPMSGPGAHYGEDSVEAIRLAEEDIQRWREQSPQHYPPLHIHIGDTKSKPLRAIQLSRKFIDQDKVSFLCGGVSSSVALAVTKVARDRQVIFVGTDHASPQLVEEARHPYYFRMSNGTRQSMLAGAKYIAQHYRSRSSSVPLRIAFIGPDYDYGYRAWDDLRYFLQQRNIRFSVATELWPKLNEKDFSLYIDALEDTKPDVLVSGHWGKDFVNLIRQLKGRSLLENTVLMNFDAGGNYDTLAELGDDMPLGLVLSARHHVNWPETQENQHFVQRFFQRTGRYPSYAAQGAYAGILAIAQVVAKTGGIYNQASLLEHFKQLRLKLPEDPDGFESYIDPQSQQIMQVQAIGTTIKADGFSPAKVMLGQWKAYYPPQQWPAR